MSKSDSNENLSKDYFARDEERQYKMKLSIDIFSIKDCKFKALMYVKYPTISELGIKN